MKSNKNNRLPRRRRKINDLGKLQLKNKVQKEHRSLRWLELAMEKVAFAMGFDGSGF